MSQSATEGIVLYINTNSDPMTTDDDLIANSGKVIAKKK